MLNELPLLFLFFPLGFSSLAGEIVTWPKVHMISNRMRLERAIERGRRTNRSSIRARSTVIQGSGAVDGGSLPTTPGLGPTTTTPGGYMPSDTDAEDYMTAQARSRRGGPGISNPNISSTNLKSVNREFNDEKDSLPSTLSIDEKRLKKNLDSINEKDLEDGNGGGSEDQFSTSRRSSSGKHSRNASHGGKSSKSRSNSQGAGVAARLWAAATMSPTRKEYRSNRRRGSNSRGEEDRSAVDQEDGDTDENQKLDGGSGEKLTWSRGSMSAGAGLNIWERERELDDDSDSSGGE